MKRQTLFDPSEDAAPEVAGPPLAGAGAHIDGRGEPAGEEVARAEAMEKAGRMLGRRPMSVQEVRDGLGRSGFDEVVVDEVILRLEELGLLDDLEFARRWAEHRLGRGRGPTLVIRELESKGVERGVAEQALAELQGDEEDRAVEVAARLFPKVARRPLAEQGLRLMDLLVRRGFERDVAEAAARKVLPPEGWD